QHLDLLNIVGGAGDERRGTELLNLVLGIACDRGEDVAPQVTANAHGDFGTVVDGGDGTSRLDNRDGEHRTAQPPNGADVAGGNAVVDDVRVDGGQVQTGNRLHRLKDNHRPEQARVGAHVLH